MSRGRQSALVGCMRGADFEIRGFPKMPALTAAHQCPTGLKLCVSVMHASAVMHTHQLLVYAGLEVACSAHKDILDVRAADS